MRGAGILLAWYGALGVAYCRGRYPRGGLLAVLVGLTGLALYAFGGVAR